MAKLIDITGKALSGEWGTDDETGDGIPVLRTTNFTNVGVVDYSNVVTRTISKKNIDEKFLRKGDIIIEKSGGSDKFPVGRVVYFDGDENTYLFNNFTGLLRVNDKKAWYPKYVFYSLFANYRYGGTRVFENKTTGLHNLKIDDYVSRYEVEEVGLSEQILICNKLDKLYGIIQSTEQELQLLDMLIKARFIELFGTVKENPYNFPTATLKEVCYKITDGKHGGCEQEANSGYYYIGAREIYDGVIHYDTAPQITYADFAKDYRRCNIEQGDMVIVNTGATIGKSAIAVSSLTERTLLQKSVALLKVKTDMVSAEFLRYCYMANPSMYMVKSASAQPNLLLSKMNATVIYLPPLELQKQFSAFVTQTDKSKEAVQKSLEKTQQLFDSLMQEYFG